MYGAKGSRRSPPCRSRSAPSGAPARELATRLPVRAVVLLEGPSDAAAVTALAANRGRDLAAEGVFVLSMGGAMNVGRLARLLGPPGLGLRLTGLCDEAERPSLRPRLGAGRCGRATDLRLRGGPGGRTHPRAGRDTGAGTRPNGGRPPSPADLPAPARTAGPHATAADATFPRNVDQVDGRGHGNVAVGHLADLAGICAGPASHADVQTETAPAHSDPPAPNEPKPNAPDAQQRPARPCTASARLFPERRAKRSSS